MNRSSSGEVTASVKAALLGALLGFVMAALARGRGASGDAGR